MNGVDSQRARLDNETWLIDCGHKLVEKKRAGGVDGLTPRERLIHCFWIADYSMRNAGDLAVARDLDPNFLVDARRMAEAIGLGQAIFAFGLSEGELERRYFDLFEGVCSEIRAR